MSFIGKFWSYRFTIIWLIMISKIIFIFIIAINYFIVFSIFEGSLIPSAAILFGSASAVTATLLGAVMNVALFVFYYKCLRMFSVWLVKIFLLNMPVFSAAAAYLLYGDALSLRQMFGIIIIILGALLTIRSEMTRQENLNSGHKS